MTFAKCIVVALPFLCLLVGLKTEAAARCRYPTHYYRVSLGVCEPKAGGEFSPALRGKSAKNPTKLSRRNNLRNNLRSKISTVPRRAVPPPHQVVRDANEAAEVDLKGNMPRPKPSIVEDRWRGLE